MKNEFEEKLAQEGSMEAAAMSTEATAEGTETAANSGISAQALADELNSVRDPLREHAIVGGKCLEFTCGAGKSSVDLYTGRHIFEIPLFRNQDVLPVSLIYNSDFKDNVQAGNKVGFGMGLSIQGGYYYYNEQGSFMDGAGRVDFLDYKKPQEADGTTEFGEVEKRKFKIYTGAFTGIGSSASKSGIYHNNKNVYFPNGESVYITNECFGAYNKLCDADDIVSELKYNYSGSTSLTMKLNTVKRGSETILSFTYNSNGLVETITKGSETVTFGYDSGKLRNVQRTSDGVTEFILNLSYNTSRDLIQAESYGKVLRFTFAGGKVDTVEECARYIKVGASTVSNDLIGNNWSINYINGAWTRVTDKNKLMTDYFFGEEGKLIAESVAPNATVAPYDITRGNMHFSQVQCFQGNVTISATPTAVMRERIHSCQAALANSSAPSVYKTSINGGTVTELHKQNVYAEDLIIFTCWVKATGYKSDFEKYSDGETSYRTGKTMFGISAEWYSPNEHKGKALYVPLQATDDWQFIAVPFRNLENSQTNVIWYLDLFNNSGSVQISNACVYETKGNWRVSLDRDYSIEYGSYKNEVSLYSLHGFTVKKLLRENYSNKELKTYTAEYEVDWRIKKEKDYSGITTSYSYDGQYRCTGTTASCSALSTVSSRTYSGTSGRIATESMAGGKVSYTYNNYGDCLTVKLPNGDGTTYTYDNRGQMTSAKATKHTTNTQSITYKNGYPYSFTCGSNTVDYTYDGFGRVLEVKENGTKTKSVVYRDFLLSADGVSGATNVATVTFANGFKTASYTDKYGQLLCVKEDGSTVSSYTYNADGSLKESIDKASNSVYNYDYTNGVLHTVTETRNGSKLLEITYEDTGRDEYAKTTMKYGGATDTYTQTTDELGQLTEETTPLGKTLYARNALGSLTSRGYYGESETYSYWYPSGGVGFTGIPNGVTYKDGSAYYYTYDASGNITKITNRDGSDEITYAYDSVGRLISETRKGKYYRTVGYDINGNISERNEYPYENGSIATNKRTRKIYSYSGGRLLSFDGKSCSYDANGNPTTYLGTACEWERGRLLKKFGSTEFAYNAEGLRIQKGNKEYIWSGDRLIAEKEDGAVTMRFCYDATGIAGYIYRGSTVIFRKNLQGDVIGLIDNTGELLGTYEYDAWGNCTKINVINTHASMALTINPIRYRGYYYDSETGLYYLQSRYYDPQTGRFISPDAYSYLDPATVNGLNLHSYCNNNPVMNVDPSGHLALAILLFYGITIAASIGIGIGSSIVGQGIQYGWDKVDLGQAFVDGIFAGISAGLAATGIGLPASMFLGGVFGVAQYAIASKIHNEEMTWGGALTALGFGIFAGYFSGAGARNLGSLASKIYGDINASAMQMVKQFIGTKAIMFTNLIANEFIKSAGRIMLVTAAIAVIPSLIKRGLMNNKPVRKLDWCVV